jgi:molybdopterin/thiamine biosynthesis adenylyltransferase
MPGVDHMFIVVDAGFPLSDPRVFAPQAPALYRWPHVEERGLLCLMSLQRGAAPSEKIILAYNDAVLLAWFDDDHKKREFNREFRAYWNRRKSPKAPLFLSLIDPRGQSREIWYFLSADRQTYVFGDTKASLRDWLTNRGQSPADREIVRTLLAVVEEPPIPSEFPEYGRDILNAVSAGALDTKLVPGVPFPLLIQVRTETGITFAGVVLQSPPEKDIRKGFRNLHHVPRTLVVNAFASRPALRCRVERVDAYWIHGRDRENDTIDTLRLKRVAVFGCGALGAAIARYLVQTGVGNVILVDGDNLESPNTSRHVLGHRWLGQGKAEATAAMLRADFPHVGVIRGYNAKAQDLSPSIFSGLAEFDLVITAGIDLLGDDAIDRWRSSLDAPPPFLATWAEEFALAGHAVLLRGKERLLQYFDENFHPRFAVTDWPSEIRTTFVEAGCGTFFQPHSAVDLSEIVSLGSRMALDALLGVVNVSCRRLRLGDRERVLALGGIPRPAFDNSNATKQLTLEA